MRRLTEDEAAVYSKLALQIAQNRRRNLLRTRYADAEAFAAGWRYRLDDGGEIPQVPLYWPQKAVDVFSSRMRPRFFSIRDESTLLDDLERVYLDSSVELAETLAIKSSLRHGPAFVFVSAGLPGEPEVVVSAQSALTASCLLDPRTRRVTAALELLDDGRAHLYLPGRVLHMERGILAPAVLDEYLAPERVLCAPFIHGASIEKPFGESRITRSIMGFTDQAVRTFGRQEVSAEWYQYPREKLLGVAPESFEGEGAGFVRAPGAIDALPDIHPDDEPTIPDDLRRAEWHTFPQMSMQPFSDQFRLIASQFSGASSIPLQYLGIVQDSNPTSAAAIEAQDVDLVRAVEDQTPAYSWSRRMLAINILTVLHGEIPAEMLRGLAARWHDPRHKGVAEQGQFVAQQVQAGNLQPGSATTLGLLPISSEDAKAAEAEARRARAASMLESLTQAANEPDIA